MEDENWEGKVTDEGKWRKQLLSGAFQNRMEQICPAEPHEPPDPETTGIMHDRYKEWGWKWKDKVMFVSWIILLSHLHLLLSTE